MSLGNEDMFQRLGAFGVAVAIGYYTYINLISARLPVYGQRELDTLLSKRSSNNEEIAVLALRRTCEIEEILLSSLSGDGSRLDLQEKQNFMLGQIRALSDHMKSIAEREPREDKILADNLAADARVLRVRRVNEFAQAVVLVLGTLQWGFGDLVVSRFRLCGDWYCS